MEDHAAPLGGVDRHLLVLLQQEGGDQGGLVGIGPGELFPAGLGLVGGQFHPGRLAVVKEEEQLAAVVPGDAGPDHPLLLVHGKLGGQVVPQHAGLGVLKFAEPGLIALLPVGKDQQLVPVGGLPGKEGAVAVLILLLAGHPQGLGGDFLQISLPGQEEIHRVVGDLLLSGEQLLGLVVIDDIGAAGEGVLFLDLLQLTDDDLTDAAGAVHQVLEVSDLLLQGVHLLGALEDVLLVDVPQADVGYELGLDLVNAKADHQVGHYLRVLLGLPDDADGPVDVQQDALEALEQVQLLLLLLQGEVCAAAHAVAAPGGPLLQDFPHPHHPGHAGDEDVEVAGLGIHQRGHAEQLGHELVRVGAPL